MKIKTLNEKLRTAINEYLKENYGATLPPEKEYVIDETDAYLYMNEETGACFYIEKSEIEE